MQELTDLVTPGRTVRLVDDQIYSVLSDPGGAHYDRRARLYDWAVASSLYNRIAWGNTPADYKSFARAAFDGNERGWHLDAGGGSLLFTSDIYRTTTRPVVVLDRSLAMLRQARARLRNDRVVLLQGDLLDLPFRSHTFASILCMHVLHVLENGGALLRGLAGLRATQQSTLALTSLVRTDRVFANTYLRLLYRSGELARPRSEDDVRRMVESAVGRAVSVNVKGSVTYIKC